MLAGQLEGEREGEREEKTVNRPLRRHLPLQAWNVADRLLASSLQLAMIWVESADDR